MLLDKKKIMPASKAEMMESGIRFPCPPTRSIPGASCKMPKTIMDTQINPSREYIFPSGFNVIFNPIPTELSHEERNANPKKMTIARLEWLVLNYLKAVHKPDPDNGSFYILENTTLGQVLQLAALDRKQLDVMIAPLLVGDNNSEDEDLADIEITERIRQLDERVRSLNQRRSQITNGPAEEPHIVDLVEVINGGQGVEEDGEDEELAEENQAANAEDNN